MILAVSVNAIPDYFALTFPVNGKGNISTAERK